MKVERRMTLLSQRRPKRRFELLQARPMGVLWLLAVVAMLCVATDRVVAQNSPGADPDPPTNPQPPIDPEDLEDDPFSEPASPAEPSEPSAADAAHINAAMLAGQRYEAEGRWRLAAQKYSEVLQRMPSNSQAAAGYRRAKSMLDEGPMLEDEPASGSSAGSITSASSVQLRLQEQRERTQVEFNQSIQRVRELLSQERWDAADREMVTAKVKLQKGRQYLSQAAFDEMESEADTLRRQVNDGRINARLVENQAKLQEAEQESGASEMREQRKKDRIIQANIQRVRELQDEMEYHEALLVLDDALHYDPRNPTLLLLRDVIRQTMILHEYSDLAAHKRRSIAEQSVEQQKSLQIPSPNTTDRSRPMSISGLYEYPADWPGISAMREGTGGYLIPPRDRAIRRRLDEESIEVDFGADMTFQRGLAFVQDVSGERVYTDWTALKAMGIDESTTFEGGLELAKLPLAMVLGRMMQSVGFEGDRPAWDVQDGMLVVSSKEALQRRMVLVVYDVRDLTLPIPDFNDPPNLNLGGGAGGGGGGQGGGGGGGQGGTGPYEDYDQDEEELLETLIQLIKDNIDQDSWITGTPTGEITPFNRNLVIRQTARNHIAIGVLLAQLREQRSVLINVETRFLQIDTDWFEEIGIDLDLYFNTNNNMLNEARGIDNNAVLSDFFYENGQLAGQLKDPLVYGGFGNFDSTTGAFDYPSNTLLTGPHTGGLQGDGAGGIDMVYPAGVNYGTPIRHTSGWSPIGVVQNSMGLAETIANGAFGSFAGTVLGAAPALGMGISFIDDIQVDLLVKATQADKRSIQLSAPRLTFFNGQGAWISINKQEAYVSGLSASTGDASGAFVPQVGILPTGIVLHLKGAVSADRRYVMLNVYFQKSVLDSLVPSAPFTGAAGGGFGGGGASGFFGSVQLPTISVQEIQVTTSVPDKGTALLGGQRETSEYETEVGVPLLSKVPYINRFFTNRVTATKEDTLLILLRPEIIIQTENEERLFPGMAQTLRAGLPYAP